MRKKYIALGFILTALTLQADELEFKGGIKFLGAVTDDIHEENDGANLDLGYSVGAEYLFEKMEGKDWKYGIGLELRSRFKGEAKGSDNKYKGHGMMPVYLVGKHDIKDTPWYVVGRAGVAINSAAGLSEVDKVEPGLYGALGIGRSFDENRFNIELFYEVSDYTYHLKGEREETVDGIFGGAGLKFSYKFDVRESKAKDMNFNLGGASQMFKFNKAELVDEWKKEIEKVTRKINAVNADIHIEVTGHTDSLGSEKYNQVLSEKRAAAVANEIKKYLTNERVEFTVIGMGELAPIYSNETEEGRAQNRRVVVDVKVK